MTPGINFAAAIELTEQFVLQLQSEQLSPEQMLVFVTDLVSTTEGARGFFVGYLTSEAEVADQFHPAIVQGLAAHPEIISDLLVKNLAMSTAQSLYFQRAGQLDMMVNAERVTRRSRQIIDQLQLPQIQDICQKLVASIESETGSYVSFLGRWGYDEEQKRAIKNQIESLSFESPEN